MDFVLSFDGKSICIEVGDSSTRTFMHIRHEVAYIPRPCKRCKTKVESPISNTHRKTNSMYHMHTLGASKCMHVVHIVGFAMGVGDG